MHSIQRSDVFYSFSRILAVYDTCWYNKFSQERNVVVVIYIASLNNIVVEPT